MRCEVCDRLILNHRYTKFTDARVHYLHKTCFEIFSNGGTKPTRKNRENNANSSKVRVRTSYESINRYSYLKSESDNRTSRRL